MINIFIHAVRQGVVRLYQGMVILYIFYISTESTTATKGTITKILSGEKDTVIQAKWIYKAKITNKDGSDS